MPDVNTATKSWPPVISLPRLDANARSKRGFRWYIPFKIQQIVLFDLHSTPNQLQLNIFCVIIGLSCLVFCSNMHSDVFPSSCEASCWLSAGQTHTPYKSGIIVDRVFFSQSDKGFRGFLGVFFW